MLHALTHMAIYERRNEPGRVVYAHETYLAWLGSWKAVGRALFDTDRSPVRMQTTASVPMCCVLWNSWLAATDRTASSLGMPPMEPADAASWRHTGQDVRQAQIIIPAPHELSKNLDVTVHDHSCMAHPSGRGMAAGCVGDSLLQVRACVVVRGELRMRSRELRFSSTRIQEPPSTGCSTCAMLNSVRSACMFLGVSTRPAASPASGAAEEPPFCSAAEPCLPRSAVNAGQVRVLLRSMPPGKCGWQAVASGISICAGELSPACSGLQMCRYQRLRRDRGNNMLAQ